MNKLSQLVFIFMFFVSGLGVGLAQSPGRSWYKLTTGNGHGFQVFSRIDGKLEQFLEHPYRFVAPPDERRDGGVGRRDLMHDAYFGVRVNGESSWLDALRNIEYEDQSHIILAKENANGLRLSIRYFAPFGLEANALLMTITAENNSDGPMNLEVAGKVNLKLGRGRAEPGNENESITIQSEQTVETGPGGGHAYYFPLGENSLTSCGGDSDIYNDWLANRQLPSTVNCNGNNQVVALSSNLEIEAGESESFGIGLVFLNDNPNEPQADDFRDFRTEADILTAWRNFVGERDTETIINDAKTEFENWRVAPQELGLNQLTEDEVRVWRQSESVLRMGQVREATQSNRRNFGMFLAALPEGEWHTGWVRDGVYAVVAQAMNGHHDEAREGVNFLLNAWAGFFNSPRYLGRDYRISSVRYYGNGKEEGDFNAAGPNVETDGFGLALWGARAYLHYSCDKEWLDQTTLHGDTVYEALTQTAEDIDALLINDLPTAECSIWETHWDFRQIFTYTAAVQIRGLFDFAAIARWYGDDERATYYNQRGQDLLDATIRRLVHPRWDSFVSHFNTVNSDFFVDGSTVEMLSWNFVLPNDPIYQGTMSQYERLLTEFGGYKRLEQQLSLTGGSQATRYDLSQWILLDLRIGEAWRKMGNTARAEQLLSVITDSAVDNDHLIPELFDPNDGRYEGVVPMVGYGAGAWQVAQLEKYGHPFPDVETGWGHCEDTSMGGEAGEGGAGGSMSDDGEAGETGEGGDSNLPSQINSDDNDGADNGDTTERETPRSPFADDETAGLCQQSTPLNTTLFVLIILVLGGSIRRGMKELS